MISPTYTISYALLDALMMKKLRLRAIGNFAPKLTQFVSSSSVLL